MKKVYTLLMPRLVATLYKKNGLFITAAIILINFLPVKGFSQKDFYIPKSLIIPAHTDPQQVHISLGIGGGFDANISYAFNKHLVLFTKGTLNKGTYTRTSLF